MRMAIMLGGSLDELIMCYNLSDAPSKESPCIALPYQHIEPSFSITDVLYSNKKIIV